ncbi:hypothetical protein NH340_JMT09160 [Sarcoptes scabiei]|nr:hypothetical protein NH340_JMT09160 [Sarcoptes scabiei]
MKKCSNIESIGVSNSLSANTSSKESCEKSETTDILKTLDDEKRTNYGSIQKDFLIDLIPFNHQVGGHSRLMLLNIKTLCKPLIPNELLFYLNIPNLLKDFVPNYKGIVQIRSNCTKSSIGNETNRNPSPKLSFDFHSFHDIKPSSSAMRVRLSPIDDDRFWLESNLYQNNPQKPRLSSRPNQQYYMLLENIVDNYHLPCVLDLKMGTTQHSDDASIEKRNRQIAKCAASTSARLGFRICGMQVFHHQPGSNQYRLYQRDKYHGRRIKTDRDLKKELKIYFLNRIHLIGLIVKRLEILRTKIIKLLQTSSIRIVSTSLLIVTEGCLQNLTPSIRDSRSPINYNRSDDEDSEISSDFDDHIHLFRNNSSSSSQLIKDFTVENKNHFVIDVENDEDNSKSSFDFIRPNDLKFTLKTIGSSRTSFDQISYESEQNFYCNQEHLSFQTRSFPAESNFDIRLIDFAHTKLDPTTSPKSSSCDNGFVFGLENLIRLLLEILDECQANRISFVNEFAMSKQSKRRRSNSTVEESDIEDEDLNDSDDHIVCDAHRTASPIMKKLNSQKPDFNWNDWI